MKRPQQYSVHSTSWKSDMRDLAVASLQIQLWTGLFTRLYLFTQAILTCENYCQRQNDNGFGCCFHRGGIQPNTDGIIPRIDGIIGVYRRYHWREIIKDETGDEFSSYKGYIWGSDAHDYQNCLSQIIVVIAG